MNLPADTVPLAGLRALADQTRLAMARLLCEGAFNVGEVQEVLGVGQSTASRHLKILVDAGLCEWRKEGRLAWCQWTSALTPAQEDLRAFVRTHADVLDESARRRVTAVYAARTEQARQYFDGAAAAEALSAGKEGFPNVDVVGRMMERVPGGALAVDLGTGTGRLLAPLRTRVKRVIGVDQSPRMLDAAGRRLREAGVTGVDLRLGALEHLPLANGEVEAVVAHLVLHHAAVPEQVLAEIRRVLKPGGTLVVGDYLPHGEESMRQQLADQWLGFEPRRFGRLLAGAGFEQVQVDVVPGGDGVLGMFVAAAKVPMLKAGPADRTDKQTPAGAPARNRGAAKVARPRRLARQ